MERCRRASSASGHRSLPSVVLPRPSVMLSPTRTSVPPPGDGAHASSVLMKYQCATLVAEAAALRSADDVWSPRASQVVVRDPGCEVIAPPVWPAAR